MEVPPPTALTNAFCLVLEPQLVVLAAAAALCHLLHSTRARRLTLHKQIAALFLENAL